MNKEQHNIGRVPEMVTREQEQELLMDRWLDIMRTNDMAAQEIECAQELALVRKVEREVATQAPERECVYELAQEMKKAYDDGFPVNRVAEILDHVRRHEQAPDDLLRYVDTLPTSDTERDVLRSIVHKERAGTLTLGKEEAHVNKELRIPEADEMRGHRKEHIAYNILQMLHELEEVPGTLTVQFES